MWKSPIDFNNRQISKDLRDKNEADKSMKNTGTAVDFWDTIKMCLQELATFTSAH